MGSVRVWVRVRFQAMFPRILAVGGWIVCVDSRIVIHDRMVHVGDDGFVGGSQSIKSGWGTVVRGVAN